MSLLSRRGERQIPTVVIGLDSVLEAPGHEGMHVAPGTSNAPISVGLSIQFQIDGQSSCFGILTSLSPSFAFVHTEELPRPGLQARLRFDLGNGQSVDIRGVVEHVQRDTFRGFTLKIGQIFRGKEALKQFIAASLANKSLEDQRSSVRVQMNLPIQFSSQTGQHSAELLDLSQTGLYLTVLQEGPWFFGQKLIVELVVPFGQRSEMFLIKCLVQRIDAPGQAKCDRAGWGLGMKLPGGEILAEKLTRKLNL